VCLAFESGSAGVSIYPPLTLSTSALCISIFLHFSFLSSIKEPFVQPQYERIYSPVLEQLLVFTIHFLARADQKVCRRASACLR
jgi:hypothetical protein